MNKYEKSKLYKLVSYQTNQIYVGSTTQPYLCQRLSQHNNDYKGYLSGKRKYITSFEIIKFNDCEIILLEDFPCETKEQLLARERYYIDTLDCVNKIRPGRSIKEWRIDNKDKIIEKQKEYNKSNKDKIATRENKKHACICGGKYTHVHKARHLRSARHQQYQEIQDKKIILTGLRELLQPDQQNTKRERKNIENCIVRIQYDIIHLSNQLYKL